MGKASVEKGRALEDTVELWLSLRGYAYERRARVRTKLGYFAEVDFLVYDKHGKFIVEVKNLEKPVDRDVVLKAWNNVVALGAYKAVVVSASGFTDVAVSLARRIGVVELKTLDEVVADIEAMKARRQHLYIEPAITPWTAMRWAEDILGERRLLIFKAERGESVEPMYIPVYHVKASIQVEPGKYRDVRLLASSLTGLPIAYDRSSKRMREALDQLVDLPVDLLEVYRVYAGRRVARTDIVYSYGEAMWIKMVRHLTPRGLLRRVSEKPVVVEVVNVYPPLEQLEDAVATIEGKRMLREPPQGFEVREPVYTPGSVKHLLETMLKAEVKAINQVNVPVFKVKLVDSKGNYRYAIIAGWAKEVSVYESKYFA
ncbi:MAG: restriction endonuclease [Acidilobaceae archaeon]